MQNDHSKAISGLSIAVIIISALTLACCIIGWIFTTMGGSIFNQVGPGYIEEALREEGYGYSDYGSLSTSDITSLVNFAIMVGGAAIIWEAAMCALSLVAGLMGLRNARNREKLGAVFGWNLAAAIGSLLSGRIITMALLIIVTVFAYKDKNTPAWQQPYGQPAQQVYGQPMQQPYGQPVQQAYGQPVSTPVQQTATPTQPAPVQAAPAQAIPTQATSAQAAPAQEAPAAQQPPASTASPIQADTAANPDGPIERL